MSLQVLSDILSAVLEENQRRDSKSGSASSRLQCLRCRSEFSSHLAAGEEEDGGSRVGVMLRDGEEGRNREEQTEADYNNGSSGEGCRDRLWSVDLTPHDLSKIWTLTRPKFSFKKVL